MKLAFQLAYKNLMGAGLRTWLNVGVLSFAFIIIIFYNGWIDGWNEQARTDTIEWEYAHGHVYHADYDALDPFTITDSYGTIGEGVEQLTPVLIRHASVYPEGRMMSVLLKGIEVDQSTVKIPTELLAASDAAIPAVIGERMASSTKLKTGDEVLVRWRDVNGTFDAATITIAGVFENNVGSIDGGQVWIPIEKLWEMTGMEHKATMYLADGDYAHQEQAGWTYQSQDDLLSELNEIIKAKKMGGSVMYLLLLAIALLAIFDTQVLSVFRRQKEIGTYISLGMTRQQVVGIFTVEGAMNAIFAAILGAIYGIPLLGYVAKTGIAVPMASQDIGISIADRMYPVFSLGLIMATILLVVISATIVSFLPYPEDRKNGSRSSFKRKNTMIKFLLKGILRDKNRSLLPIIIVSIGVMLTVFLSGYIRGVMGDVIDMTARFQTGHVKVMTEAYADNQDQMPNDLALLGVNELITDLEADFPDFDWTMRIRFGGLVDVPTAEGETKSQGPGAGMGIDLFSANGKEIERLNIANAMVSGSIPQKSGEALLSDDFAKKLKVKLGDDITFFGSTMNGSMTFKNFILAGTVKFGNSAMDRGLIIVDITDAQSMLDMEDGAGEILGYSKAGAYFDVEAKDMTSSYNARHADDTDEFKPMMLSLGQQNSMESMINYTDNMAAIFVGIFVFAMSLVLWNTGLLGGLRRYQEFGIRLALGESKGQIYRSLFSEAVLIGSIGSVVGTSIGVFFCFLLQKYGYDISEMMPESNMMYPNIIRARMTPDLYYIGFIPGLFSMVLGNMLAGLGIYKRETAQLFKEMEV